jgi:hypothetical protein
MDPKNTKKYVVCQIISVRYSENQKALILRVESDIGEKLKLWILCQSYLQYDDICDDLGDSSYWKFRCYNSGQIIRKEPVSSLYYNCVVQ